MGVGTVCGTARLPSSSRVLSKVLRAEVFVLLCRKSNRGHGDLVDSLLLRVNRAEVKQSMPKDLCPGAAAKSC